MNKITPCLWFNDTAEEAVKFYTSIFKHSKVGEVSCYDSESAKVAGRPEGSVLTIVFQLEGQDFMALNGGPAFKFTEAISFVVDCEDQAEVDHYWDALTTDGGQEVQCGWLKDKFGVSWQITPRILSELLRDKDAAKAQRVMKAMLAMKKIEIAGLQRAAEAAGA